jgi:hypothetical protein
MFTEEKNKLEQEGDNVVADDSIKTGCGIFGRYPIISILLFASVGICLGIGLSAWDPDDGDDSKDVVIKWIGLVGDLFIRALSKSLNNTC